MLKKILPFYPFLLLPIGWAALLGLPQRIRLVALLFGLLLLTFSESSSGWFDDSHKIVHDTVQQQVVYTGKKMGVGKIYLQVHAEVEIQRSVKSTVNKQ